MSRVQRPAHRSTTPLRLIFVEERRARCGRDEKCARSGGGRDNGDRSPPATQSEIADEQGRQMKTRSIKMSSHFFFSTSFSFFLLPFFASARDGPARSSILAAGAEYPSRYVSCCKACVVVVVVMFLCHELMDSFFYEKLFSRKFFSW